MNEQKIKYLKINITRSNEVASKKGKAVMTDIVQTNAIMYLAWRFLVLCFSGHIIALYLLTLIATKVYALTCTKHDNKIIHIVNIKV